MKRKISRRIYCIDCKKLRLVCNECIKINNIKRCKDCCTKIVFRCCDNCIQMCYLKRSIYLHLGIYLCDECNWKFKSKELKVIGKMI